MELLSNSNLQLQSLQGLGATNYTESNYKSYLSIYNTYKGRGIWNTANVYGKRVNDYADQVGNPSLKVEVWPQTAKLGAESNYNQYKYYFDMYSKRGDKINTFKYGERANKYADQAGKPKLQYANVTDQEMALYDFNRYKATYDSQVKQKNWANANRYADYANKTAKEAGVKELIKFNEGTGKPIPPEPVVQQAQKAPDPATTKTQSSAASKVNTSVNTGVSNQVKNLKKLPGGDMGERAKQAFISEMQRQGWPLAEAREWVEKNGYKHSTRDLRTGKSFAPKYTGAPRPKSKVLNLNSKKYDEEIKQTANNSKKAVVWLTAATAVLGIGGKVLS